MKIVVWLVALIAVARASNPVDAFFGDTNNSTNNGLVVRKTIKVRRGGADELTEVQAAIKKDFSSVTLGVKSIMGMYVETTEELPKDFDEPVKTFLTEIENRLGSIIEK
ncbi:hypothetical protein PSACC_02912 [Paramicrosporidium saccamoebae]|uniref:Uncharacterized protein n=1 Tax=Paramicrosporidium saccamoebae TaxID=1246581 RepID=A0A2H9THP9_9FUNG|nr:hypothetical protein PSACC_02912 [Paramicrosporidium saccamoebae]